jgi:hypothetical protein
LLDALGCANVGGGGFERCRLLDVSAALRQEGNDLLINPVYVGADLLDGIAVLDRIDAVAHTKLLKMSARPNA